MRQHLLAAAMLALVPAGAFAQAMPPAPVEAEAVVQRHVAPRHAVVGTVRAARTAVLGSESEGRIVEIAAREGDRVAKGEPIARVRTTSLEIDVRAAKAELELRKQELLELENGSRVEDIRQAQSRFDATKSELEFATWDLESADRLKENGSVSEDEYRRIRLRLRAVEQLHRQAESALELLRAGPRKEKIAQAKARVAVQDARLARLADDLERRTIRAPFDGVVVAERTELGEWVSTGDAIVEFASADDLEVRVGVVEDFVTHLRRGGKAVVTAGALPGREFAGTIQAIVPHGDERTRTFPVDVRIADRAADGPTLKPGMFVRVWIDVGTPERALLVPKDALVLGGPAPVVFVVTPGADGEPSTARPVPVRTGDAVGTLICIEAEIAEGELVVTRGNERLRPGQPIMVAGAAPAPAKPTPAKPTPGSSSGDTSE